MYFLATGDAGKVTPTGLSPSGKTNGADMLGPTNKASLGVIFHLISLVLLSIPVYAKVGLKFSATVGLKKLIEPKILQVAGFGGVGDWELFAGGLFGSLGVGNEDELGLKVTTIFEISALVFL